MNDGFHLAVIKEIENFRQKVLKIVQSSNLSAVETCFLNYLFIFLFFTYFFLKNHEGEKAIQPLLEKTFKGLKGILGLWLVKKDIANPRKYRKFPVLQYNSADLVLRTEDSEQKSPFLPRKKSGDKFEELKGNLGLLKNLVLKEVSPNKMEVFDEIVLQAEKDYDVLLFYVSLVTWFYATGLLPSSFYFHNSFLNEPLTSNHSEMPVSPKVKESPSQKSPKEKKVHDLFGFRIESVAIEKKQTQKSQEPTPKRRKSQRNANASEQLPVYQKARKQKENESGKTTVIIDLVNCLIMLAKPKQFRDFLRKEWVIRPFSKELVKLLFENYNVVFMLKKNSSISGHFLSLIDPEQKAKLAMEETNVGNHFGESIRIHSDAFKIKEKHPNTFFVKPWNGHAKDSTLKSLVDQLSSTFPLICHSNR